MAHRLWNSGKPISEQPLDAQQHKKVQPPQHKVPARAVPQTRQRPDDKQVQIHVFPVAAERYVDIIPEERAERNVPAPPEFGDGFCRIRQTEVLHERKAEDFPETDCHVGVAGKIEVDLEHVGEHAEQDARRRRARKRAAQQLVCDLPDVIGKQNLFPQTDAKARHTAEDVLAVRLARVDLRRNVHIADNRSCNELRKHRNIQQQLPVRPLRRNVFAVHVDRIRQRLKCVKRDADRKRNLRHGKRGFENRIAVLHQKSRVFEYDQPQQVQRHAQRQQRPAPLFFKRQRKAPVERCHRQHQKHIHRLSPCVEHQTRTKKDEILRLQPRHEEIQQQTQGQKDI